MRQDVVIFPTVKMCVPSKGSKATGNREVMANGRASVTQKLAMITIT